MSLKAFEIIDVLTHTGCPEEHSTNERDSLKQISFLSMIRRFTSGFSLKNDQSIILLEIIKRSVKNSLLDKVGFSKVVCLTHIATICFMLIMLIEDNLAIFLWCYCKSSNVYRLVVFGVSLGVEPY